MDKTRMGKRVASLLLSLVMMLSLLPTAAYATMADGVDTQGAIVSENGTDVSDDSNSSGGTGDLQVEDSEGNGDTGGQQVGGSSGSGTADDTTGAEGGADPTDSVNGNDSTDPQDDGDAVLPTAANVAKVGDTEYATLEAAIAALSSSSYTLELLDETAWDLATPVYWAAGSESGYAATLADALTAAYKANGDITIVCRPGTDVGKLTHGHVADDITIYGNNAYISSGECELEVDTFMYSRDTGKQVTTGGAYLEKDITVTAYELDNLGVWGQRHTDHKVTVNLTDCDSVNGITVQRVYISGTTGVNDITLTGCDFGTRATSVYSNADGAVVIDNCSFTGAQVPVNFNHKANGAQTVTVRNSTFTGCGDNGDWKQFAAPVRFVNSGSGKMDTTVGTCTFTDTVGGNGDILLGDGRVDQSSNDVKLNVANTEATVQAQQPGYYGDGGTTDESKQGTKNVAASDTLTTSVTQLMPSSELTNYVTVSGIKGFDGTKFATFADAYAAIKPVVATLGLGQETPADAAAFDAVFTDISTDGKATLTYTITGNVTYDETGLDHLLTMGRSSSHYLTNERHPINFKFVGAEADRGATLTVNSNITLPYEWWGEKITTSISFENLTITGSAPSGLFAYQSFFEGIDFKVNNCTLKGIKIYNCANVGGSYTITNSKLDGTGAAKDAYAIHLQGNDTAPLNILIENNQISGYDRGVNIDQATAIATISGNSISINDNDRSCIQLTQLAKTTVSGNSMTLTGGNAITLHGNLAAGSKIEVIGNNITGTGYLIYDAAKGTIDLTYTDNTVSDTIDTTKGVYGGKEYKVSENVANALKSDTTTYVAEVKGVKYDSLQAAINAATEKATVILLADTRENVTISTNYLTLDLNGHTLNGGTVAGQPALTVQSRVTVKDSSEEQTGTIMREDTAENSGVSSHYVIDIQDGWLFFESGSVTNNSGVVGVKGASLVRVGDDSVAKYPGLTISGGTFTQDNFIVIKVDRGTFYLKEDGTLNSKNSYAVENWKFAEIKGGTVNGTVAAWTYSGGHNSDLTISGGTVNGNVLSVNYGSAEGKVAKVSITGGTVNGALDTRSYDPSTNELTSIDDATKATIAVTGGTFSSDPTKYVVEDSAINKNDDGTFGVAKAYLAKVGDTSYYTMDEAFKAQTASSEAIVLLRDYTTGSTFNSGSINRTVDLNGHTWTCTGTDANSAAFEINNPNATLTVKNGKVVSSQLVGLIPSAMGGTIKYDNSSLVFDGVEMTTNARSGIETNGNNTNDTVTLRNSTLNVPNGFGIYFPSSGTLTIDNSVINAKTMGVQVCSGSLNVSGAETAITVSGDGIPKTINDGAIEDGAAISIVNRTGYKGLSEITVKDGKFTAKGTNAAVKAYNWKDLTPSDFTQNDKVSVSGGTFSSAVDKSLCADGYIPTQNADGTYGVEIGKFTVKVTSRTTGSNSPVANVTGGGSDITYAVGTKVTASAISGYKFVGWFVNEYTGTPYSTDLTCEVKPTADCTMIAVYEPISGGKFWLTVTASEFTVNGGAVQDSYLYEQFAVGASVTVNFTGSENFLYWVNASNKVVSTEKSYTFIMGSETTLKAVYGKARQNQATVVFISHSDQIISSKAYTTSDTIQFPVPPIKMGCTFTGWSMTEAEIRAAMANNSGIIQVRALYTEPSIACSVTVIYPDGIGNDVVNAVVGKAIDVTAKDIEGKTFSYWTDDKGTVLGYTKTLKLAPSGDMTVKAVYDEAAEAKPVITISEVSATTANESYVVTFMATRAVPDGYKVVKQGILWSRDAVCGEDGAAAYMQFDSNGKLPTGVNAYIGNSLELNGVTRLDITTKYNDRTFYGRGYMVLESDAGELLYIYTNTIASGSYDSLTK